MIIQLNTKNTCMKIFIVENSWTPPPPIPLHLYPSTYPSEQGLHFFLISESIFCKTKLSPPSTYTRPPIPLHLTATRRSSPRWDKIFPESHTRENAVPCEIQTICLASGRARLKRISMKKKTRVTAGYGGDAR